MFPLTWYSAIIISLTQTILMIKIGIKLYNLNISNKDCFVISLITAIAAYFISHWGFTGGVHTIFLFIIMVFLVYMIGKITIVYSFMTILTGLLIAGLIDNLMFPLLLHITGNTVTTLAASSWLHVMFFIPSFTFLILLYAIITRFNVVLFDLTLRSQECQKIEV